MRCTDCRDALGAYVDGELMLNEQQEIRDHLASCDDCAREHDALAATVHSLREGLVRHAAPDVLKARIRNSLAASDATAPTEPPRERVRGGSWGWLAAAGVVIALASSGATMSVLRERDAQSFTERDVLASHIRSLMPGHLTDVASTNQHNVKPWFNGRLDLSPTVPNLDSAGFTLIGGRLDYVDNRQVAAVVYGRRQHMINVYSWPSATGERAEQQAVTTTENGYHLIRWRTGGVDMWVVSDVSQADLDQFVRAFRAAQ